MLKVKFVASVAAITATLIQTGEVSGQTGQAGVWRQQGYGRIIEFGSGAPRVFHTAGRWCVTADEEVSDWTPASFSHTIESDTLRLIAHNGNVYSFIREPTLPANCGNYESRLDPETNFDYFWYTFQEQYPFFGVRGIDWDSLYSVYRPQVSAGTTDDELFSIFEELVTLIQDGHVGVRAGERVVYAPPYRLQHRRDEFLDLVDNEYLAGNYNVRAKWITYGSINDDIGYIRIRRFSRFGSPDSQQSASQVLDAALDEAITSLNGKSAVVVDVRFNGGGNDLHARHVAARFTDRRRLAYSKAAFLGEGSQFSELVDFHVEPTDRPSFAGRVVVLANGASASATEIFLLSMAALPQVTFVGEPSFGVFSDILWKPLPNGWVFWLGNELYTDPSGVNYEARGFPPDHVAEMTENDLDRGVDRPIEAAVELLANTDNLRLKGH